MRQTCEENQEMTSLCRPLGGDKSFWNIILFPIKLKTYILNYKIYINLKSLYVYESKACHATVQCLK